VDLGVALDPHAKLIIRDFEIVVFLEGRYDVNTDDFSIRLDTEVDVDGAVLPLGLIAVFLD
jgi:hypothetical protein